MVAVIEGFHCNPQACDYAYFVGRAAAKGVELAAVAMVASEVACWGETGGRTFYHQWAELRQEGEEPAAGVSVAMEAPADPLKRKF